MASVYVRTLVFCLVLGVVSAACLLLLFLDHTKAYAYLIIASQVGVLLVIVATIVAVYHYKSTIDQQATDAAGTQPIKDCPDYWTKIGGTSGRGSGSTASPGSCISSYTSADGKYRFEVGGKGQQSVQLGGDVKTACAAPQDSSYPWTYLKLRCDLAKNQPATGT